MYQVGVKFHNNVIFQMIISVQFVMFGKKLKVINKSFCNIIIRIPVALPISDEINLFQPNKKNECNLAFHTILCNCGPTMKKTAYFIKAARNYTSTVDLSYRFAGQFILPDVWHFNKWPRNSK